MYGFAEHEISNDREGWSKRIHPADRERVIAAVQRHFADSVTPFEQVYRMQHKDGSYRWVRLRLVDRGLRYGHL